jgi:serine/threonine-protein kinase
MSLQQGQVLDGKYKIVRVIGEGGMGAVYEGENVRIRRRVAIKVLHAGVASNTEMVQRFEREAQVAGTVGNDHILEILDMGALPGGERYMVMEYLDGETMTDRIKVRGRLTAAEAVKLLRQVLRGLAAAHGAGIVHRDLKPDNIFILKEKAGIKDYVKIIDFGISKFSEQGATSPRMTRTGALMGTPHYMAPEQATGSTEIDRRTDIYAVGIIMYEAVTGRVPFQAETFNQLLFEIALAKIIPARQVVPELDPAVDSIIMKASARDPAQRFQTCDEFAAALEAWERSGSAVSVPPEQSLEAIFAASVPRASGSGAGSTDDTISADTGRRSVSKVSVGGAAATARSAAPPGASAPPVEPTVNTWASSSQAGAPQKLGAPVLAATALGFLLLAGAGIGAYVFFKSPSPTVPTPSARTATAPLPPSEPSAAVQQPPPPVESAQEKEGKPPEVAPTSAATATVASTPATTAHATAKPLVPHHKPADKTPKPDPQPKPKPGINFGY